MNAEEEDENLSTTKVNKYMRKESITCKFYEILTDDGKILLTHLMTGIIMDIDGKSLSFILNYIEAYPVDLRKHLTDDILKGETEKSRESFINSLVNYILCNSYGFSDDEYITSYDISVYICFSEELYGIFGEKIPIFPYRDTDLYEKSIEYIFGDDLPSGIREPLKNYLQYTLSLYQNIPYEDMKTIVHKNSINKFNARLNLAGELMLITCSKIRENYKTIYGKDWKKNLNFLTLLHTLKNIKI